MCFLCLSNQCNNKFVYKNFDETQELQYSLDLYSSISENENSLPETGNKKELHQFWWNSKTSIPLNLILSNANFLLNFIKSCTAYKCGILAILVISFICSNVPPNNEYPMSTMKYYHTNNILPSSNAKCTCVSFRIQYPHIVCVIFLNIFSTFTARYING